MLEGLLGSDKKEKILLHLHTHGESYAREIASTFDLNLSTVQNHLLNLESGGVIYSKFKGKVLTFLPRWELEKFYTPRLRPRRTGKDQ